ncbi:Anthranilate synthase component 1 [Symmachiella macrocystis]|uniref:Anthranilate synthase component 1 n=1 Tax=Symmachiella macrocystis TaxID=2527985 RepID=A0A5C6BKI4_9PLAN|nr:anthranilate synthase component I [Symmachiella macrocystis]TWU12262.1 Anthranilate synthase component 1 [Symmachiella macrocystis]
MKYYPDFDTFAKLAADSDVVPIYRQLVSDTLTPLSAYSTIQWGPCSFLFESVVGGEQIGRYSILGADPFLQLDAYGTRILLTHQDGRVEERDCDDPLHELEVLLNQFRAVHLPGLPRFAGGAVGYAGYDTVRYAEHLPDAPKDDRQLPDLSFAFYDRMVIFDQINKTVLVVVHARTDGEDLRADYDAARKRVDELCKQLQMGASDLQVTDINLDEESTLEYRSNFTQPEFEAAVESCKEYIRAGDIFQVVLSQRLELETHARPLDIYRSLRVVNPSPFMFLLKTPAVNLIGSSPEIMVRVEDGQVTIRPLAGTRKRGATEAEDERLSAELLADPKERAEHVMLVDLGRNDVGRIAQYGTVELSDMMVVEKYSHVMHITSNVTGQLAEGRSALDALRAGLPAGTVSGAPKVRAMEIIDEFEPHRRGPYAGAVGYVDFTGNMDTCIALRTMVMQGQTVYVQAGAGIVADSVPESEYQETLNKARGLLKAIEIAEQQL